MHTIYKRHRGKEAERAVAGAGIARQRLRAIRVVQGLVLISLFLFASKMNAAVDDSLDTTITYLIEYVRDSKVTFKRNFSSHDSYEAAEHIENKYNHFVDEIDSPETFIELCATRSLVTGRSYQVVTIDGEVLPSSVWLLAELHRYRAH